MSELSMPAFPGVLAQHAEILARVLVPCVGFRWTAGDGGATDHDPGGSRLYGDPDLPEGFAWPATDDGQPLPFALQVDLDAAARRFPGRVPLPDSPGAGCPVAGCPGDGCPVAGSAEIRTMACAKGWSSVKVR